jgi:hypothetical protein
VRPLGFAIGVVVVLLVAGQPSLPAASAEVLANVTLILSSPNTLVLSTGATMQGSSEVRIFFARDGNTFFGTYDGGGVVLPPGTTSGSFTTPDGTQYVADISGPPSQLRVDVQAREPIQAAPGAAFDMRTWYVLRVYRRSCTILQGDSEAGIEGNIPITVTLNKGQQTCSMEAGRHLY